MNICYAESAENSFSVAHLCAPKQLWWAKPLRKENGNADAKHWYKTQYISAKTLIFLKKTTAKPNNIPKFGFFSVKLIPSV